jgi:hypothetical protein
VANFNAGFIKTSSLYTSLFFIGQNFVGRKQHDFAVALDGDRIIRLFVFEQRGFDGGFNGTVYFFAVFDK